MSDKYNEEPKTYVFKGKTYYEVSFQKRDTLGKVKKRKSRFNQSGNRITSKASAKRVLEWLKGDLENTVSKRPTYSWSDWKERYFEERRKEGLLETTVTNYRSILDKWQDDSWDSKKLSDFTRKDVSDFIHTTLVNKGASDWTRKNVHKRINKIFEVAIEEGEIAFNPARGVKVHAKKVEGIALTAGETEKLLEAAVSMRHEFTPHWIAALLTGMRNGELYALRYSKLDLDRDTILVDVQFTSKDGLHLPKAGKVRTIDLNKELKAYLLKLKKDVGPVKATLWEFDEGKIEIVPEVLKGKKTGRMVERLSLIHI